MPLPRLVGANVPETSVEVERDGKPSANVRSMRETGVRPPTDDISILATPVGPTSNTSTSRVNEWEKSFSVTVRFVIVPLRPATFSVEG